MGVTKQIQVGADGCGWVRVNALGRRGHGNTHKQGEQTQKRLYRTYFGVYGRGNFPGHDVLCVLPKMVKNEFRWGMVNANECNGVYGHGVGEKAR